VEITNEFINTDGRFADGEFPEDEVAGGDALLGEEIIDAVAAKGTGGGGFAPIKNHFEETGHKAFDDPEYYKKALAGGGDLVQRLHKIFQQLLQTKDIKDRAEFRLRIVPVFWDYMGEIARQSIRSMPDPKRYLLRFALLHPGVLSAEHRRLFSTIINENNTREPVYYLDEWLGGIGRGEIRPSTTDEVRISRMNTDAHLKELHERAKGKLDASKGLVLLKHKERLDAETHLKGQIAALTAHIPSPVFAEVFDRYTDTQRKLFAEVQNSMRVMIRADREIEVLLRDIENTASDVDALSGKLYLSGKAETTVDTGAIDGEFQTVRQMVKMSIGRRGNSFPILSGEYFHCLPNGIGTRENVISVLSWIETIDEEVYIRVYRKQVDRIVPYVILLPTYGDLGFCWEPFERLNKATSRGRIVVPMYPKNLTIAVLLAVADLRWQAAKEKASYYWMEEGLTGNYYQWFAKQKLRGDIKSYFMQDYLLWMTKESEGIQKLDKELRGIFWRYMPFTRPVKERLKDRNLVYQDLYQRDQNRAKSDL
jgi:hypothetical protein